MDYKNDRELIRDLNKALDGLDKELREKKRQQLNTRFAQGTELLREKGVKEHKIQEGIKAAYETARRARDTPSDDPVIISAHTGWRPGHGQIFARHQYRRLHINRTPNAR